MSEISLFPNGIKTKTGEYAPAVKPEKDISFEEYIYMIRDGEWQDDVLMVRNGKMPKGKMRGVTTSGTFSYRRSNDILKHSGIIAIDIDDDHNIEDLKEKKEQLKKDKYVHGLHYSVRGFGLVAYVKIDPERHLDAFLGLEKYFADEYSIVIDPSCKNVDRYRYVSYDPDLYYNKKSATFKKYIPKKKKQPKKPFIFSDNDLDHIFQQINDTGANLVESYHDWIRVGFALYSHYGESGRGYFHTVSANSSKYDVEKCDKQFDKIVQRGNKGKKQSTIATFLWRAKEEGLNIKTPRTESIERVSKLRIKSVGTSGGSKDIKSAKDAAIDYLKKMEGIEGPDVVQIVDQVSKLDKKDLHEKSDDLIADIEAFLKQYDLKFNEITRDYEIDGRPMIDRDYNTLYISAKKSIDIKITKDLLFSIIDSDHTDSYHPFQDFINKYKHLRPSGNFEKLCECITYRQTIFYEDREEHLNDYLEIFLKKWLISIIASMHGTYSLLILVLTGGQRVGKTKFFRNLLPDELMSFYAESKLDDGKDSEILMTKKLIILDDEFGGKSKQDAKRLKDLSSKQWFNLRRPFGRAHEDLKRLAVLCGTSNDDEVINDPSGNRRIIPLNVIDIDHDKMSEIDKIDLFMELYHEWKETGDEWMLSARDVEMLNLATGMNEQPSIEEEMVMKYFKPAESEGGAVGVFTNTDIKTYIESRNKTLRINTFKLGATLKKLGYRKISKRVNGSPKKVYLMEEIFKDTTSFYDD